MVWGASSGAGKSLLATSLCRWAARQGVDVAPYKAQNMSNNARVVPAPDGGFGEIGAAQYFQALAARAAPTVHMNPVLLKPERDTASQVVLRGRVARELSHQPWRERSLVLADAAHDSFRQLAAQHELLVIEGAGSPAEINLAEHDYVNLHAARWARAAGALQALVVSDIDRGGAFAHCYGTWALLPDDLKPALAGFVLNKFRGDAALLAPGPEQLRGLTGVPVLGVLPMQRHHGLPEEDGVYDAAPSGAAGGLRIAIVAPPQLSNLDEFQPLRQAAGVQTVWARSPADLRGADWVVLPGSKQVSGDLAWLRAQRLAEAIQAHAAAGGRVLGICGGLQMLGLTLHDEAGFDGEAGVAVPGLGLLPLHTRYAAPKRVRAASMHFGALAPPWQAWSNVSFEGYEIRHGLTGVDTGADAGATVALRDAQGEPLGWQAGPVLGLTAHGLFESSALMQAMFGARVRTLDEVFDGLADLIDAHFEPGVLRALTHPR